MQVGILDEHAPRDIFQDPVLPACWNFDESKMFLGRKYLFRRAVESRSGDDFEEELRHFRSGCSINRAVHADHASEGRDRIAFESTQIRFGEGLAGGDAAR